jgi:elongation factor G
MFIDIPVLCGSGSKNIGVAQLLDLIVTAFPSPGDRAPLMGRTADGADAPRARSESEPMSALVFKTLDSAVGKLSVMRVFSGVLKGDSDFYNATRKTRERIGQINLMLGAKLEPTDEAGAGDIIAVAKLKETLTGDTLVVDDKHFVTYPLIEAPPPVISYAIHAKSKGDEDKIGSALHRLCEEDFTLRVTRDEQTKEMLLSGLGQVHVETYAEKLKRKFKVEVDLTVPKVPYKETCKGRAEGEGKHKKQSGGRGQFGVCYLRVEPMPRSGGFEYVDAIVGGSIPRQFIPSVEKGIVKRMADGVIAGYPVVDVRVTCFDGKYHDVDSSDIAFQIAGRKGFQAVFKQAKPCLLEPIVAMEITVPEQFMGDVIGDLSSRRGRVAGYETVGKSSVIKATVPLSKVQRYAADLRSMTSGQGNFGMHWSHNEEVPPDEAQKIVAAYKGEEEEEDE